MSCFGIWNSIDTAISYLVPIHRILPHLLPVKCAWEKLAWPSKKTLLSEFMDMLRRIGQLGVWSEDLVTPQCVWLPGLFNPTAYLTAVMQVCGHLHSISFRPKGVLEV